MLLTIIFTSLITAVCTAIILYFASSYLLSNEKFMSVVFHKVIVRLSKSNQPEALKKVSLGLRKMANRIDGEAKQIEECTYYTESLNTLNMSSEVNITEKILRQFGCYAWSIRDLIDHFAKDVIDYYRALQSGEEPAPELFYVRTLKINTKEAEELATLVVAAIKQIDYTIIRGNLTLTMFQMPTVLECLHNGYDYEESLSRASAFCKDDAGCTMYKELYQLNQILIRKK